ncbi:MAG: SpoIIE family protein phosphatase [Bacteroidia bacterium]
MKKIVLFNVLMLSVALAFGQTKQELDSLKHVIATCKNDTNKVNALLALATVSNDFTRGVLINKKALELALKLNYTVGIVGSYNQIGDAYWYHSDYDKAQENYFKAYKINDAVNNKKAMAQSLYNMGWIYCVQQHDYSKAHYLFKSLHIYQQLNDTLGLIKIHNAIGTFYYKTDKIKWADSALFYYNAGVKYGKIKSFDLASIYCHLFEVYFDKKEYAQAMIYNTTALRMSNDSNDIAQCMLNATLCDIELGKPKQAIIILNKLYTYILTHDYPYLKLKTTEALANAHYKANNYKESALYYKQYATLNEVVDRKAFAGNLNRLQENYIVEKNDVVINALQQKNELEQLKNKQQKYTSYGIAALALGIFAFAVFMYRQNKQRQKTNLQLVAQNTIIAQKNEEIQSSIKYAKGIQQALLTSNDYITKHLSKEYFIYYEPKDIVSGDFYWAVAKHNLFYIAVADCTGHGVPGAFMSLLNINFLNENVIEQGIQLPNEILNEQRKEIIQALNPQGNENSKDGMDCVLCAININENKLQLSASNNPLWLVRNNELIEYKADKMPVGKYDDRAKDFTLQEIQLQTNDVLYMFTDGYADQFGGEKGKKFMYKQFKALLLSIAHLPMAEQQRKLQHTFEAWKGDLEQVDDVCVMGIRI